MSEDDLRDTKPGRLFRPSYSATFLFCEDALLSGVDAYDTAGVEAAIGTVFHELMHDWQKYGRPDHWLHTVRRVWRQGKIKPGLEPYFDVTVDEDMFVFGQQCLDRYAHLQGDRYVETYVDISDLTPVPDQGGTADLAICGVLEIDDPVSPSLGTLDVIDWKYGTGVQVFAPHNTQLLFYAYGFFKAYDHIYDFQRIRLHIAQPRIGWGHFDVWEITREELLEWAKWAKERNYAAYALVRTRTPSPKACQWCKVRVNCGALNVLRERMADESFDVIDAPVSSTELTVISDPQLTSPFSLSSDRLAKILRYRGLMEKWFSDIYDELLIRVGRGEKIEGWKLVIGRSSRGWAGGEEGAIEHLTRVGVPLDELYEQKLISPNKAKPLLRKVGVRGELMEQYLKVGVDIFPGKPTLAPDGDNRSEIPNIADDSFDVEPEL